MLGCLLTFREAYALAPDLAGDPFQDIVLANVFRLQPPTVKPPEPVKVTPLPPIALTGILDGFNRKLAFLEAILPVMPPNQAKPSFLTLAEGELAGEIQVLRIDVKAGTVTVKLCGIVTNLNLNINALKAPGSVPLRTPSLVAAAPLPTSSQPISQLSRDEYAFMIEAERERLKQSGDPTANLMPPTHLTPAGAPGTEVLVEGAQPTELNPITPAWKRAR